MTDEYSFGYPRACTKCAHFSACPINLQVAPFFRQGTGLRVMLIGQDPTIVKQPERVQRVLMLDQGHGQLTRWLQQMFGRDTFHTLTMYATNIVKCSFDKPPSSKPEGGWKFLQPYFRNCKDYLINEVTVFYPDVVLTFGEPAHKLFTSVLDNRDEIPPDMQGAFTGQFYKAKLKDVVFDYSPCLHIKTFRVAETYGESVKRFRDGMASYFRSEGDKQNG